VSDTIRDGSTVVCWQCEEIDERIAHYRAMTARVTDKRTFEGIDVLVEKMEAQKTALNPG
jgi:hypothetical protein